MLWVYAVGDIMLGSITPVRILPPDSGKVFVESVKGYLEGGDIVMGNLEGAFIKEGMKPSKCSESSRKAKRCYEFGMPGYLANRLKEMGFNVLTLDNNHSMDYGFEAYNYTKRLLDSLGILAVGKREYKIMNIGNIKVAIVPFGFSGSSWHISDTITAKSVISSLKDSADVIIVSFHGGAEGGNARHVRNEVERFYGENRGNVMAFAHAVINAGADLVIGHGPHVLRGVELYKGRLIAYSLGNFLTYGNVNIGGYGGITAILKVMLDSTGKFVKGEIVPIVQKRPGIPVFDGEKRAIEIIRELTNEDFNGGGVEIKDDGLILPKE